MFRGELVEKKGGERVVQTEAGALRFKMGFLEYFLYAGKWDDFERRDGNLGWFSAGTVGSHMTGKQRKCAHDNAVIWDEEQRLPTKLHPPSPARILFFPACGLGAAFKL